MKYKRPYFLFTGHLETIYPALFRSVSLEYERELVQTPDDDLLELDWVRNNSKKLVVISHGLEGNSTRAYVKGMARAFVMRGFDALAWNFRGCGDDLNRQLRFYHSGATEDLDSVILHARSKGYKELYLVGFSLGGNLTLKYAGERIPYPEIKKVVAFSTPLDLYTSCLQISKPENFIYANRFVKSLKQKIVRKAAVMPGLDIQGIESIKSLIAFDDRYTAPLHGFKNAREYYQQCSSINFVPSISIPTLIVNAQNDPFLSEACYPVDLLKNHPFVKFEDPVHGGHVGFAQFNKNGLYWSEERAVYFCTEE